MPKTAYVKPRILIVEDERIIAEDLKTILEKDVYRVVGIANTSRKALDLVEKMKPDLVLMDISLKTDPDGVVTASYITQNDRVPVVFITAYASRDLSERVKVVEPYGYITKPYTPDLVYTTVEMALYKHRMMQNRLRVARSS